MTYINIISKILTKAITNRDTGIGHLTKNYLRAYYQLPKKTSFRKAQCLV